MIFFKSCKECKPPKRKSGCHASCPEYRAERVKYDAFKKAEREAKEQEDLWYSKFRH